MKVTISVIKADVGGYVGHSSTHPKLIEACEEQLQNAKDSGKIIDYFVGRVGDDINLIMTHKYGVDNSEIHKLAWDTFKKATEVAKELKLYGAGQDLLSDAFSGNVKGMGPGVAEMEINERPSEPIVVFMADKTSPSAWNIPLYEMFADPMNTSGLVIDPSMHEGFVFEVLDVKQGEVYKIPTPEGLYDLLALIGSVSRYVITKVFRKKDGEIAAVASSQKLSLIAGKYVGKDDPVMVVRAQSGFPAVGEILEPFAKPFFVEGWMRGSHMGPLMPVPMYQSTVSRFDGPPRVVALGFQLSDGKLIGPRDLFDDPAFDEPRRVAQEMANIMRRQGIFEPSRLPEEELEYTTLPMIISKLKGREVKKVEHMDVD
ncbi:MAG: fructose-1,6-bisphosphate aldolase/phosphatase [candidate division WOR-3 bacterium]